MTVHHRPNRALAMIGTDLGRSLSSIARQIAASPVHSSVRKASEAVMAMTDEDLPGLPPIVEDDPPGWDDASEQYEEMPE